VAAFILLRHSLRRARFLVLGIALVLSGFQLVLSAVAASFQRTNAFGALATMIPPLFRQFIGPSTLAMFSFSGIVCAGYFHPIVIAAVLALVVALATEPAAEIDAGFADLVLARPTPRHSIVTRSVLAVALSAAFVLGAMLVGTRIGLRLLAPAYASSWPSVRLVLSLVASLGALAWCWAGVAMAIAVRAPRRGVAGAATGVLALAAFLIDYVGRVWPAAQGSARLSPFHYYSPMELVMGTPLRSDHLTVLLAVGCAGFATSYVLFARRDI
jgi:beta-exotoxin I transport system permease protein